MCSSLTQEWARWCGAKRGLNGLRAGTANHADHMGCAVGLRGLRGLAIGECELQCVGEKDRAEGTCRRLGVEESFCVMFHSLGVALLWVKHRLNRLRQVQRCVLIRCGVPMDCVD